MTWARFDDQADDHPKIAGLTDKAFRWWFRGCLYSNRYLLDGVLPASFLSRVPGRARVELIEAGLWEPSGSAVLIHDFHDYNPTAESVKEQRRRTAERVKRFRNGGTAPLVTDVKRDGNTSPARPGPVIQIQDPPPPRSGGLTKREAQTVRKHRGKLSLPACPHEDAHCANEHTCVERLMRESRTRAS